MRHYAGHKRKEWWRIQNLKWHFDAGFGHEIGAGGVRFTCRFAQEQCTFLSNCRTRRIESKQYVAHNELRVEYVHASADDMTVMNAHILSEKKHTAMIEVMDC
jgi:hypothetical protein